MNDLHQKLNEILILFRDDFNTADHKWSRTEAKSAILKAFKESLPEKRIGTLDKLPEIIRYSDVKLGEARNKGFNDCLDEIMKGLAIEKLF